MDRSLNTRREKDSGEPRSPKKRLLRISPTKKAKQDLLRVEHIQLKQRRQTLSPSSLSLSLALSYRVLGPQSESVSKCERTDSETEKKTIEARTNRL